MSTTHILLGIGWVLYCFVHSFLASESIKHFIQSRLHLRGNVYRIWYNILAFVLLVMLIICQMRIKSILIFHIPVVNRLISLLFLITGGSIMFVSIIKYFRQFSGFDQSTQKVLQRSGLHSHVRHPLYLGTFIFLIGIFLWRPLISNALATGIIIIYILAGIKLEEKKLVSFYGNEYKNYQKQVLGIIPRLWSRRRIVK